VDGEVKPQEQEAPEEDQWPQMLDEIDQKVSQRLAEALQPMKEWLELSREAKTLEKPKENDSNSMSQGADVLKVAEGSPKINPRPNRRSLFRWKVKRQ